MEEPKKGCIHLYYWVGEATRRASHVVCLPLSPQPIVRRRLLQAPAARMTALRLAQRLLLTIVILIAVPDFLPLVHRLSPYKAVLFPLGLYSPPIFSSTDECHLLRTFDDHEVLINGGLPRLPGSHRRHRSIHRLLFPGPHSHRCRTGERRQPSRVL